MKRAMQTQPRQEEMRNMSSPTHYVRFSKGLTEGSEQDRKLTVYIYNSEYAKIKNWVLLHPNIETGGDLFGLWFDSHTAVVQLALGPGKNCRRTATSFFQDLDYLATAGGYLTKNHGLCNLGQWHSHHQLSLSKPSHGDENTVWSHMPTLGLKRYIVCIANISKKWNFSYRAGVNCFLFELDDEGKQLPVLEGEFHHLEQQSPTNEDPQVMQVIEQGAESIVPSVCEEDSTTSIMENLAWYVWSKCKKCICCDKRKALAFFGLLAFTVIGRLLLYKSSYKKNITSITENNSTV